MPASVLAEALAQPATTLLAVLLLSIFLFLHWKRLGYGDVGLSYEQVVGHRELWRCATAQLAHIDVLHIVFNLSALWSIGIVERSLGTAYFLQQTTLFFILGPAVCMLLYHLLVVVAGREQYRHVTALGYSIVLFAWMTLLATKHPGGITMLPLFGLASVPAWATPWASLAITSLLIPQASFIGHLAGILAGYTVAFGPFDRLPASWAFGLLLCAAAGLAYSAGLGGQHLSYIRLPGGPGAGSWRAWFGGGDAGGADMESGSGSRGGTRIIGSNVVQVRS